MNRMTLLPYHDESHVALTTLGDLTDDGDSKVPIAKRLGAATKVGMESIANANEQIIKSSAANL